MKRFFLLVLILTSIFSSCSDSKDDDFYSAINELIKTRFPDVSAVFYKTLPVFSTAWGNSPIPKVDTSDIPVPPPPGIIYYDRSSFEAYVKSSSINSAEIEGMAKSIDSTKTILIESKKINLSLMSQEELDSGIL